MSFTITNTGVGNDGYFLFNTYGTNANNLPLPNQVSNIEQDGDLSGLAVVDRFWSIDPVDYSTNPTASLSFSYEDEALAPPNNINENNLEVIRWEQSSDTWFSQNSVSTSGAVSIQNVGNYGDFSLSSSAATSSDFQCPGNLFLTCGNEGGVIADWTVPTYTGSCLLYTSPSPRDRG